MQETEIIEKLRARNEAGISALLLQFGPLLRYIIAPILKNTEDREEALSETALRVWEHIDSFDPEKGSFTAWLTAAARNTALNHARKNQRFAADEALNDSLPSAEPGPEEALLLQERQSLLTAAVRTLSKREQQLFYRKYYYRQSTAQIAAETGMTERAVEGRLYRLRLKLRAKLGGDLHG